MKKTRFSILVMISLFLSISLLTFGQDQPELGSSSEQGSFLSPGRDIGGLECLPNSLYSQAPVNSDNGYFSDDETTFWNQTIFDSYSGVTEVIGGITFWGQAVDYPSLGDCYTPGADTFDIIFYQDDAGTVGASVKSYTVIVTPTVTGANVGPLSILRFDVTFPSPLYLENGWVSIVKKNPANEDCLFAWVNTTTGDDVIGYTNNLTGGQIYYSSGVNVSFCLVEGTPPPVPISNWAIILGVLLIGTFIVVRYRRTLA